MTRYTVWHSTGKRDGDSGFDAIEDAQREYDDQVARADVVEVELIDNNSGKDGPIVLKRHDAAEAA